MAVDIPPAVADLLTREHPEHGPIVRNDHVAVLFGTDPAGLRRWRSRGKFPEAVHKEAAASWYRQGDVAKAYRDREAAGLLPERIPFQPLEFESEPSHSVSPITEAQAETPQAVPRMGGAPLVVMESGDALARLGASIGAEMRGALTELLLRDSEKDATIGRQADAIASLTRQLEAAQQELRQARTQWGADSRLMRLIRRLLPRQ